MMFALLCLLSDFTSSTFKVIFLLFLIMCTHWCVYMSLWRLKVSNPLELVSCLRWLLGTE